MLNTIQFCIKFFLLSAFILVLGNWIRWDGKTISDQVKIGMSKAEDSQIFHDVQNWAERVTRDARKGVHSKINRTLSLEPRSGEKEEITHTERQKLKALIKELNSSHASD